MTTERTIAPYGSWRSPIGIDDIIRSAITLAEPWLDGGDVYWLEGRPTEGGRRVLVRRDASGATADLTPAPANVRTRVHEYGGGSYTVAGGTVVYSEFADGRLYRLDPGASDAVPITPEGPWRYADLRADPGRRRFIAVREDHGTPDQPRNELVAVDLDGASAPIVLVSGPDFVAAPRVSPAGDRLAWIEWDHPDMPWDATRLRVAAIAPDGSLGIPELVAGGLEESIVQPEWSPGGELHFVSDRTGWWNLYRLADGPRLDPLAPMEAEFADPSWVFGRSSYAFLADGSIVAAARRSGRDRLFHVRPGNLVGEVESASTEFEWLFAAAGAVVAVVGAPDRPSAVVRFDPETLAPAEVLRQAAAESPDAAYVSRPESIAFPTSGGRTAYALYYPPLNPDFEGPAGERPPLVVLSHGGPTANASTALDPAKQLLTSRGIAVVDVDYGGSTGYGRAYRRLLDGAWGRVDVEDCAAAALFLAERGDVDRARLAIKGGSAGGFTTLAALAFKDVFSAGISLFGVGDLEALARLTHKFESRYLDRLVGPLPAAQARYRERSPIYAFDRIRCPVLVLQGLDDRVVTPDQAEAIVAALAENGIPYGYIAFEGEGHGFRGAPAMRRSLEAELSFLGQVFGFEPADELEPLELQGGRAASPA
ncbi:MAG TPA: prolyl oligopeptidase family serine peptidase [Clostridia bacterium]|nr:prolyl oligopeptidase family serine peptidase [Clostridia bacterium]